MSTTLTLPRKRTRLLLVGDDRPCLATLHSGLNNRDLEPVNATSGKEAMEFCRNGDMDLAMVDVVLPDMCGLELGRLLFETYHIPVIYLTREHECAFIDKATREGAFIYLVKPVQAEQIAPAVEDALARADELAEHHLQQAHLKRALDQDRRISMCVGVLMERYRLGSEQAYAMLRNQARSRRTKLADIAAALIQAMDEINQFIPAPNQEHGKIKNRNKQTSS